MQIGNDDALAGTRARAHATGPQGLTPASQCHWHRMLFSGNGVWTITPAVPIAMFAGRTGRQRRCRASKLPIFQSTVTGSGTGRAGDELGRWWWFHALLRCSTAGPLRYRELEGHTRLRVAHTASNTSSRATSSKLSHDYFTIQNQRDDIKYAQQAHLTREVREAFFNWAPTLIMEMTEVPGSSSPSRARLFSDPWNSGHPICPFYRSADVGMFPGMGSDSQRASNGTSGA
ncbi:hypothetical protein HGRIS_004112 [Hohenbuehelia grisea]|uniref:Uncharacterized protein n=1 Tax=Hohenbuehelia grisea TaxID=104357 RepID=A0ABR3JIP0_9AGAR